MKDFVLTVRVRGCIKSSQRQKNKIDCNYEMELLNGASQETVCSQGVMYAA